LCTCKEPLARSLRSCSRDPSRRSSLHDSTTSRQHLEGRAADITRHYLQLPAGPFFAPRLEFLVGVVAVVPGPCRAPVQGSRAPRLSEVFAAGVTLTALSSPEASTSRCRLRPGRFFPASWPLMPPDSSKTRTLWLSTMASEAAGFLPSFCLVALRRFTKMRCHSPSRRQRPNQ
jgi:hypothetical protein